MLNIFYQNKTLNDTLIINLSNVIPTRIKTNDEITTGYNNNEIVFMNIENISKKIDLKLISNGLLFPTSELLNSIKKIVQIDLSMYFNNGFKVGIIKKCEEISGTHLHKCIVSIKDEDLNIVCGANNAKEELKVVVATNGTMLPDGKMITNGQVFGNFSAGMLCSYKELLIDKESKGIIELDDSYQIGDYFREAYVNLK